MNEQDINHVNISLNVNNKKEVDLIDNTESTTLQCEELDHESENKNTMVKKKTSELENKSNQNMIDNVLNNESVKYKKEPWCKLDKTTKIRKITEYVNSQLQNKYMLNKTEIDTVSGYLIACLDKVKLQRVKDVDYRKDSGEIINIPSLYFDKSTRKFTLKRCDRRVSTLKSLSKPKKKKKSINK